LNEDIKLFLDPSIFANFAEIITGIAQRAQELKSGVLDKCVNNEELQKRNPRCAQAIQSLFSEFRTEEGEGNFQAYMDISEDLNRLMNDDVWEEVQSECNK
jgi:dGTP triphosphohydrolase